MARTGLANGARIVFSDMDGTLLDNEHRPIPASAPTIARLGAAGVPFVLVSARMPEALYPVQRAPSRPSAKLILLFPTSEDLILSFPTPGADFSPPGVGNDKMSFADVGNDKMNPVGCRVWPPRYARLSARVPCTSKKFRERGHLPKRCKICCCFVDRPPPVSGAAPKKTEASEAGHIWQLARGSPLSAEREGESHARD